MAMPPSLTKSWALSSRALPTPTTIRRDTPSPGGAMMSSADPFLPLNRSAAAARVTRSPVGSIALRAADPNLSPSSQNRTRTPLADAEKGANPSLRAPDIRDGSFGCALRVSPMQSRPVADPQRAAQSGRTDMARLGGPCKAPPPGLRAKTRPVALRRTVSAGPRQAAPVAARQRLRINFLLCMVKGFALAKPFCCDQLRAKRDRFTIGGHGGTAASMSGFCRRTEWVFAASGDA